MEHKWVTLEKWLSDVAFKDYKRKNGDPMCGHSIDVGRRLIADNADDITIFTGYCHDVLEDVTHIPDIRELLHQQAVLALGEANAKEAIVLVEKCSYSPIEYNVEKSIGRLKGKAEGKKARKRLAIERWLGEDERVKHVKLNDVKSNLKDAPSVSPEFQAEYEAWAVPFMRQLEIDLRNDGLKL